VKCSLVNVKKKITIIKGGFLHYKCRKTLVEVAKLRIRDANQPFHKILDSNFTPSKSFVE